VRTPRFLAGFGVAFLTVLAAFLLRVFWWPVLGSDSPFLFFFSALVLAAWYGGLWPGVVATLFGGLCVSVLPFLPIEIGGRLNSSHAMQYLIFIATGILSSFLMEKLHMAVERSTRAERELETRVRERTAELVEANLKMHHLSGELLNVQENERLRISKELHDELGQALTLIKLKVGLIDGRLSESQQPCKKFCVEAAAHVDQAIENMRRLSRDLSPVSVETLGISLALRRMTEELALAGHIRVTTDISRIDNLLPLRSAILLYRIVQEGLNNIVKHSGATAASVSVRNSDEWIHVELKDNGSGFDLDGQGPEKRPATGGLGLAIMTERVRVLGGTLAIESRKEVGTMIYFNIPIQPEEEARLASF